TNATLPAAAQNTSLEVQFDFLRVTSVSGAVGGCMLMASSGAGNLIWLRYEEGNDTWWLKQYTTEGGTISLASATVGLAPAVGTTWRIKIDIAVGDNANNQYTSFAVYYSTNGGTTWNQLISSNLTITS